MAGDEAREPATSAGPRRAQVPAAERALAVLRLLAAQPRPVPAAAIARELDLPRSTTYHLLAALERHGFVAYLPEERRYGLGVAAFEVGSSYLRHEGLERLARPLLADLLARLAGTVDGGVTAHLGVLDVREVLYLLKEAPPRPPPLVTEVGVRLPAHLTASGRCLLAALPPAQLEAVLPADGPLPRRTARGPDSRQALLARLRADAERGWSAEDGEITEGYASVAAAARDHTGRPAASVAVTFARDSEAAPPWRALAADVGAVADRLTGRLGGRA